MPPVREHGFWKLPEIDDIQKRIICYQNFGIKQRQKWQTKGKENKVKTALKNAWVKKICFEKAKHTYSILTYIGYVFICVLKQVKFS